MNRNELINDRIKTIKEIVQEFEVLSENLVGRLLSIVYIDKNNV